MMPQKEEKKKKDIYYYLLWRKNKQIIELARRNKKKIFYIFLIIIIFSFSLWGVFANSINKKKIGGMILMISYLLVKRNAALHTLLLFLSALRIRVPVNLRSCFGF